MFSRTSSSGRKKKGRRSPLATASLILVGLLTTGGAYALFSSTATADDSATPAASQQSIDEGQKLFASNCATCHGLSAAGTADGPSLIGVGSAAVDFQVGTGRMPMAVNGPQAEQKPTQFSDEQVADMAAYIASLAPGPAIPADEYLQADGDTTNGAELFRINCAMCHNVAGAGGALTQGKFAPALDGVASNHIYEAMLTGPQNMPVFNDMNLSPQDKADIITYLKYLENNPSPGGFELGSLGPVAEGLFIWIFGLGAIVAVTIWLTARSN
ncbi:cytochrome bc1 complex diheme cytochrome c subunit [Frigoribacterium faeni]|uniref:Cytochrome bc1 complex cytochrome c subunit n=1 Tax=Frigoribacterium faeni TaxID=145483 RepID=A0A7W3JHF8_9MICO|nr:cytochrome c [Frigoribacterium faeni]MBA8812977.1 ubiquinol-cytochrome c reductase cytochrome c subunit [Frigoribacterium faeni]BFF14143.1 c-type cytochrome [Microbacterium flavescens]GEK82017.1 cystathionine beta-lyase [Frigoribacterium faeni]